MRLETRKLLDKAFSGLGLIAIGVMAMALLLILTPIVIRGSKAFVFKGTIEHRRVMLEQFDRGNAEAFTGDSAQATAARAPVYEMMEEFEAEMKAMDRSRRSDYRSAYREVEKSIKVLLGPAPGERTPVLLRQQYGQTRWDRTLVKLHEVLYSEEWDYSNTDAMGVLIEKPRVEQFAGTRLEPLFHYMEDNLTEMMRPKTTFYWQFITDKSKDSHIFGGIWPEVLGTIYLTLGAMIFAIPMGVIAAIYLCEYAKEGRVISFLRICISTLAGVPSIVFGLFGLAFFLNTIQVSDSKSVLAGSLTLSLLILPTIIRSSEEAILAVPRAYKEAALGLGAGRWHTVLTVILPAALPGILTGIVISMGRAAGETAPIIFTAAVSVGAPLKIWETLNQPTPALPWNIYNLCTEHEAVDEIRHVQYGMVFTLVANVLLLNLFAILMRARISKKLRG
ncbi:MAG: phosphate ABC transporter permease PstA [Kiritimatiellales bacterium]|nr:phosphate ABC transporter permease PstA [Kiritimatiellales bacterium]